MATSRMLVNERYFQAAIARPRPSRGSRLVLVPWVLAIVVLAGFVFYATLDKPAPKLPSQVKLSALGGLVWGDTVIWNKREMRFWLGMHGATYPTWAKRHPAGRWIITHKHHHHRTRPRR